MSVLDIAMTLSITTYFWKLHPIIKRLDLQGEITPKGYSKALGIMITGFLLKADEIAIEAMQVDGGNHAQLGNYGEQKGDPAATISPEQQQNIAVDAILKFIGQEKGK